MASTSMIAQGTEYNASESVKYTKPKVNASGGKNVGIMNASTGKGTYLSTPLMLTWGVNVWEPDQAGGRTSYDMSLQFPKEEYATESTQQFLDAMIALEEKIKADAVTNSKEWFNKNKMSSEVVDALWTPMLKYPKNEDGEPDTSRPPTLKIKLPFWEDKFNLEVYDMNQQILYPHTEGDITPVDLISKGQNVAVVIQNGGIWFANGKFGTTWKLVQAVVQPRASILGNRTCCVMLSEDDKKALSREVEEEVAENVQSVDVVDSEEEDADEQNAEPEPEPVPAPKKKKVVRRKKVAASAEE